MEDEDIKKPKCSITITWKYLIPTGLFFALLFTIAIPPIIVIYIIPLYINNEFKWNPVCSYHESDDAKFQCMPNISQVNLTEAECNLWNCCWTDTYSETIPKCFYPKNYGYNIINSSIAEDNCSIDIILSSVGYPSIYGQKYQDIHMQVICINDATVRIKLTPFNSTEPYEVPLKNILKKELNDTLFNVIIKDLPFEFQIERKINSKSVFSTSSDGLIFSDTFWQISSFLPSSNIYGLGQGNHKHFKHTMEWERWILFNNYPNSTNETNLYGSHPFYLCMEDNGYANGVLLWNSNAMEIALQAAPAITYRTLGGIFDFYFFLGDTPDKVISQMTDIVGKPPMPPYWALGFHICQRTKNLKEFFEDITRLGHMHIPLESACVDTEYMGLSASSDHATELVNFYRNLSQRDMHVFFRHSPFIFVNALSYQNTPNDIFVQISDGNETKRYQGECLHKTKRIRCHILDFTNNETMDWTVNFFRDEITNKGIPLEGLFLDDNTPLNYLTSKNTTCNSADPFNFPKYTLNITDRFLSYRTLCMDVLHHNEQPHYNIHNLFGHYHLKMAGSVLNKLNHNKRPFLTSLSTFSGSGKYGGHWFPDNKPTWTSLRNSLIQILEFGLYGMSLVGSPMCGIRGESDDDVCLRWIQLMSFMPLAINYRSYGESQQDPSTFSKIFISEAREALSTRYRILPYLYTTFYLSHIKGIPVARPLFFEFPKVAGTYNIINQYMLGSALMVSPTFNYLRNSKEIYLPPQTCWYDFNSGKLITSDFDDLTYLLEESYYVTHLHIRGGYILPSQKPGVTTKASRKNKFVLVVAPGCYKHNNNTANGQILIDDGESIDSFKNDHIFVNITLANNTLWFQPKIIRTDKSTKLRNMIINNDISIHVEAIRVLKVHKKPRNVIKNELNIPFKYSQENKALLIFDMALDLQYDHNIMWTFDDNSTTSPAINTDRPTVVSTENTISVDATTTSKNESHSTSTIISHKTTHISTVNTEVTMDAMTTFSNDNTTPVFNATMNVEITSTNDYTLTNTTKYVMTTPRSNDTLTNTSTDAIPTQESNYTTNFTTNEMTTIPSNDTSPMATTDKMTTPRSNGTLTNGTTDEITTPKSNDTLINATTDKITTPRSNDTLTNGTTDEMTTPRSNGTLTNGTTDEITTPKSNDTLINATTDKITTPRSNDTLTNGTTDEMTTPRSNDTLTNGTTDEMTTTRSNDTLINATTDKITTPRSNDTLTNGTTDEMTTTRSNNTLINATTNNNASATDIMTTPIIIETSSVIIDVITTLRSNDTLTIAKTDSITTHEGNYTINFIRNEATMPQSNDSLTMTTTYEITSRSNVTSPTNSTTNVMTTPEINDTLAKAATMTTNRSNDTSTTNEKTQIINPTTHITTPKDDNVTFTIDVKTTSTNNSVPMINSNYKTQLMDNPESVTENVIQNYDSTDTSHNNNKVFANALYNIYLKNRKRVSKSNNPKKNVERKTSRNDKFSNEFEWA